MAGLVVGLVMLSGGGGPPRTLSREEAREEARRLAPRDEDWGLGFVVAGEAYDQGEYTVRKDCVIVLNADRPGTLASLDRWAERKEAAMQTYSYVRVFGDAATAEGYIDDIEDGIHRCPALQLDKVRYEDSREWATTGSVPSFDEMVSEEGRIVTDEEGRKVNEVYADLTGQTGRIVMHTFVTGPAGTEAELRQIAVRALQRMHQRLPES
ncbi:hypothetical protein [Streptomyces sp. NPDC059881]|uniref:hypothetical protein n=1 Tax=Streptomyces sp. NPDC059881 TaxID=3346986 RepID=UPI0036471207